MARVEGEIIISRPVEEVLEQSIWGNLKRLLESGGEES